jgi:hypothetical protein
MLNSGLLSCRLYGMAFRKEFVDALTLLAVAFDRVVEQGHERPVLVGGGAVEFYTGGAVMSGDLDVVTDAQLVFENALVDLGFKREDRPSRLLRGLYHATLGIDIEVVSGLLFDGASDKTKIRLVDVGEGHVVAIAPLEDMIADRMGQYAATTNHPPDMLAQAVKLLQLADKLDDAYLDRRIREETLDEFSSAYLKAQLP